MKKRFKNSLWVAAALLLIAAVIVTAVLCIRKSVKEGRPVDDPLSVYQNAIAPFENEENISYHISAQKERILGNEIFNENSEITITAENAGSDGYICSTDEQLQVGSHTVHFTELYTDNTVYMTAEGVPFCAQMSREEWLSRLIPSVLVDASLYKTLVGLKFPDSTILTFTKATAPEAWLRGTDIQLISADATVVLDKDGALKSTQILISYTESGSFIRYTVTAEPKQAHDSPIVQPEDTGHYTPIENIDAPRMLEIACGYLLEANSITAHYTDTMSCEAFGDRRSQDITIHTLNTGIWSSRMDTRIDVINSGMTDAATGMNKTSLFANGKAAAITDGEATQDPETDAAAAKTQCQDILVGTIALPQHICATSIEETETALTVHFTANEDFAQLLASEASMTLYRDGVFLSALSQSYETKTTTCYLTVDKITGLPLASGFTYAGVYTIDELPYELTFSAAQTYDILGDSASAAISEAAESLAK